MTRFLAHENIPTEAVDAARQAGLDVAWVRELNPGTVDDVVLSLALADRRVLVTFDKDNGELAFRRGQTATPGVILLRTRLREPDVVARFVVAVLTQPIPWEGHFCVARDGRIRLIPLPL
jgi:predicted nuclease of predicted toxin-antitoxin system